MAWPANGSAAEIPLKVVDPSDTRFADAIESIAGLKGIDPDVIKTTLHVLSVVQEDKEKREQKKEAANAWENTSRLQEYPQAVLQQDLLYLV